MRHAWRTTHPNPPLSGREFLKSPPDKADISCVSDICVALQTDCYYNLTMIYEWDENKREANLEKHGIDFEQVHLFDWQRAKVACGFAL